MDLSFKLSDNSKKLENFVKDTNATFADIGSFSDIGSYEMECKDAKLSCPSKLFLKDLLGLTGCEISVNMMTAGSKAPFAHKHKGICTNTFMTITESNSKTCRILHLIFITVNENEVISC